MLWWLLLGAHVAVYPRFISHPLLAIRYHHLHVCWLSAFSCLLMHYLFLPFLDVLLGHRHA
jgi:hypothetical protein